VGAADLQSDGGPEGDRSRDAGLHGTLAVDGGITSHAVAAAPGHESFRTTAESYAQRDAVSNAQQKRVLGVPSGRETRLLNPPARWGQSFPNRSLDCLFNRI